MADRKDLPGEDAQERERRHAAEGAKRRPQRDAASQDQTVGEEGARLQAAGGDPELRGRVRVRCAREDVHAAIGQGVGQIEQAYEKVGDAQKKKGVIAQKGACVPDQQQDAPAHGHGEELGQGMEKEEVAVADKEERGQQQRPQRDVEHGA